MTPCKTLTVPSPFDMQRQALYYLPPTRAVPWRERGYHAAYAAEVAPHVQEVVEATRGRALVLFSSWAVLEEVALRVEWPALRTQREGSRQELADWLRQTPGAVLFGVASFWEGLDVPGEALSCVVVDKIPFPPKDDPMEQARKERLGSAYWDHIRDVATLRLRQGVGRLIRTETDRGLVVLLDPRLRPGGRWECILRALPGAVDREGRVRTLNRRSLPAVGRFLRSGGGV